MLRAATRLHLLQAGVVVLLVALLGWGIREWTASQRAATLVRNLPSAHIVDLQKIVQELGAYRRWADPLLVQLAKGSPPDSKGRLHASLALLPVDPGQVDYLYKRMLEAMPEEFAVIREALGTTHSQDLVPRLWTLLEHEVDPERRFRAACALAYYDASHPRWATLSDQVVQHLVKENQAFVPDWTRILQPIRLEVRKSLIKLLRDPTRPESERTLTASLIAVGSLQGEGALAIPFDLYLDTDGRPSDSLLHWIISDPQVVSLVNKELAKEPAPEESEKDKDHRARHQAHAAVVLLQLDQTDGRISPRQLVHGGRLWPLLRHGSDPRVRTYLLHRLGRVSVDPETLLQQFEVEQDVAARRALLLSLGEFAGHTLVAKQRRELSIKLLPMYREDPDPGIHSAIDWLLHLWGQGKPLAKIDQELAGQPPAHRGWYVSNRHGHTLSMVRDPGEFLMGSPAQELDRQAEEPLHRKRIPRSFAIATKEVTVKQFREFLQSNPDMRHDWVPTAKYSPNEDGPMLGVTWFEAARYCRWLSEQEGIPDDEMCYPPIPDIQPGMQMPANYLSRTGYRLPTEAEWEYACRAGALTSRYYGVAEEMLGDYAWYGINSGERTWRVGSKKPNDFGLFDIYGNAGEWCQDAFAPYPPDGGGQASEDRENTRVIGDADSRVLRGGAFISPAPAARSAARSAFQPGVSLLHAGLRVARTYR
jgi:formylglycine-generating enzyme required for sulfatase activity